MLVPSSQTVYLIEIEYIYMSSISIKYMVRDDGTNIVFDLTQQNIIQSRP